VRKRLSATCFISCSSAQVTSLQLTYKNKVDDL
jgi:hypothetical protein